MRVGIVGGGIVGLANAWRAAERGAKVTVFERRDRAEGASARNFGMVWPIGQPNGRRHATALQSRRMWLEAAEKAGFWIDPCGSLHLAHTETEWQVLREFNGRADELGYECELLGSSDVLRRSAAAKPDGLRGGLWSPTEVAVDSREVLRRMPPWLREQYGVEFHYGTSITAVESFYATASTGEDWEFDEIIIASGDDFQTLFPEVFTEAGFQRCKLQMLRTVNQPGGWRLGPMIATGLTLRHYEAFAMCPSLKVLREEIAARDPRLDEYGIHVLMCQNSLGEIVIGDSHEYGDSVSPFRKEQIDALIVEELRRKADLPTWEVSERWNGYYAKLTGEAEFESEPCESVRIVVASGGAGMTLSFGFADERWRRLAGSGVAPSDHPQPAWGEPTARA